MVKHSKRTRRRLQQSGLGRSLRVFSVQPRRPRQLPRAPRLTPELEFRLRCVECSYRDGVTVAAQRFGRSRATVYRWRQRYRPEDLTSLAPRSRRPKRGGGRCGRLRRSRRCSPCGKRIPASAK